MRNNDIKLIICIFLGLATAFANAQAFKCRGPKGEIVISDTGCYGNTSTESVRSSEYISPERARQAREVNARNSKQLQGIEAENAAYRETVRQQNEAFARADAQRAATDRQKSNEDNLKRQRDECGQLATKGNMGRSQRAALSEICATPEPDIKKFDDCKEQIARANTPSQRAAIASACTGDANSGARVREVSRPAPMPQFETPAPLSIIKNCNGASCSDQMGNRYNTTSGKTVRQDGKRCYKQGNAMYCD